MQQKFKLMPPKMLQMQLKAQELNVKVTYLAESWAGAGCWLHLRFCLRCSAACPAHDLEVPLNRTCTTQDFTASHRHMTAVPRPTQSKK